MLKTHHSNAFGGKKKKKKLIIIHGHEMVVWMVRNHVFFSAKLYGELISFSSFKIKAKYVDLNKNIPGKKKSIDELDPWSKK